MLVQVDEGLMLDIDRIGAIYEREEHIWEDGKQTDSVKQYCEIHIVGLKTIWRIWGNIHEVTVKIDEARRRQEKVEEDRADEKHRKFMESIGAYGHATLIPYGVAYRDLGKDVPPVGPHNH